MTSQTSNTDNTHNSIQNNKQNNTQITCRKKPHETADDARIFQVAITGNKPFWVYLCTICNKHHVSFKGPNENIKHRIIEMIQNNDKKAKPIEFISKYRTRFTVDVTYDVFEVIYNRRTKTIQIVG